MRYEGKKISVVGAGLAGSEAAFQLASRGFFVELHEMRPLRSTEAHVTSQCAELVCSNSFGSDAAGTASKLLKDELDFVGAFVLSVARKYSVPAGASRVTLPGIFAPSNGFLFQIR